MVSRVTASTDSHKRVSGTHRVALHDEGLGVQVLHSAADGLAVLLSLEQRGQGSTGVSLLLVQPAARISAGHAWVRVSSPLALVGGGNLVEAPAHDYPSADEESNSRRAALYDG